jgi:hypothetical protein
MALAEKGVASAIARFDRPASIMASTLARSGLSEMLETGRAMILFLGRLKPAH